MLKALRAAVVDAAVDAGGGSRGRGGDRKQQQTESRVPVSLEASFV